MIQTIIAVGAVVTALASIGGVFLFIHRLISRFERLEQENKKQHETNQIIIEGVWACLDGLHQQGCNGAVTETLNKLKAYIIRN